MVDATPNPIGDLPPKAARMLEEVHQSMVDAGHDERTAWAGAWCTVDRHYRRDKHGRWRKRRKALPAVGAAACASPSQAKRKRKRNPSGKAIERGTEIEAREHPHLSREEACRIASDHLREDPRYYGRAANPAKNTNPTGAKIKRGPVAVSELASTSEHGHVLVVTVQGKGEQHRFRFKSPRPVLQWAPHVRALVWVAGVRTPRRLAIDAVDAKSRSAFERFHGRGVDGVRVMRRPQLEGEWSRVGRAVSIEYSNPEKWGTGGAEHDFTSAVTVYRFGGARGPAMWVLRGGSLRITSGGIEG
jgi:hypothetical protein